MSAYAPSLLLLTLVWSVLIYLLEPAGSSMMAVWDSSETYAHGYVIPPLALWLIWRKRHEVLATSMRPDPWALIPATALAFVWLAGGLVSAQVVQHYALVGLLIIAVLALYGRALVWVLLFPLFYLLLMVPAGDSLIEPMIHFTADFTVMTLRLIGIPVLQEGTFIELPTGQWSVVEACSGIRYFLSSIVLGWLYAYLTYRTWWKRVAFGVASIVVPVIANGFRAVIIVLLGHYSGMTLAVG
ncbi:MAG TPA: exosortase, partial [Rhodocyclaceae bacterium]|nr:exosortase [Rhodocyclaceae bacterium]